MSKKLEREKDYMAEKKRKSIAEEAYEALYGRKNRTKGGYFDGCDDNEYDDDDDDDCYCE